MAKAAIIPLICLFFFAAENPVFSQYIIKGKVTDAATGEPLPFAVIQFAGTDIGTQTDFDGNYALKSSQYRDSIKVVYVGYKSKTRKIAPQPYVQIIHFQLTEDTRLLNEVVVNPGENPAWEILRRVQKNKPLNDKRKLVAYENDCYTKVEVAADNISQKMRKRKMVRKVIEAIDSMKKVTNDEGKPIIPLYVSENLSKVYFKSHPERRKEVISAQKIIGVLNERNGMFVSQLTGSTYTDFNFYQNWMRFLGRDFVSPIAESWKDYYEYDLEDSLMVDSSFCYKINIKPKREADLAFKGTIWITKNEYALKRLDVTLPKNANINFVERVKIAQELEKTPQGPWLPTKVRFLVDMAELTDSTAGFLVKYYVSNKNIKLTEPLPEDFYREAVVQLDNANQYSNQYWQAQRHDSLSETDKQVFAMVDTIRKLPIIRSYVEIFDLVFYGYKSVGKFDIGPYYSMVAINNIEGLRLRAGFRTNFDFSKKVRLNGYAAFGSKDQKLKWGGGIDYWLSKRKWFLVGAEHSLDLEMLAIYNSNFENNSTLFNSFYRWGMIDERAPFYLQNSSIYTQMDVVKGITPKLRINYQRYDYVPTVKPQYQFGYYENPLDPNSRILNSFHNTELVAEVRIARKEDFLYYGHNRVSVLRRQKLPILTLRYQLGLKGVLESDFNYQKYIVNVYHRITVGKLGLSIYNLNYTYIQDVLPFPLLNIPLGNQTLFYNSQGFSLMNFFEFVTDRSLTLNYQHYFNGLLFNRIPWFEKLKWREVFTFNALWGAVSGSGLNYTPDTYIPNGDGRYVSLNGLDATIPYAEVGLGIENIFKLVRIEGYRRLTYLNQPYPVQKWGIKIGMYVNL